MGYQVWKGKHGQTKVGACHKLKGPANKKVAALKKAGVKGARVRKCPKAK